MDIGEEQTYDQILKNAHRLLLPDKKFSYDITNECNMIKVAIKDLVKSQRPEVEKYTILLQLAADSRLDVNPQFSLWEIGSAIQDYYMNTCLNINPDVTSKLLLLWGKGVRQQVANYSAYCNSIVNKLKPLVGETWEMPRHAIIMLFDPEIGWLGSLEMDINDRYPEIRDSRYDLAVGQVIMMKIMGLENYLKVYNFYAENQPNFENYVSREPYVTENEIELLRHIHKFDVTGKPFKYGSEEIMNHLNWIIASYRENLSLITPGEAEFIFMVRDKLLNGEYPIDILWDDVCRVDIN